jgi:hypothetical protein
MFTVTFDSKDAQATIQKMIGSLTNFPEEMARELTAWQHEDMHRQKPNTSRVEDAVFTIITQHTNTSTTKQVKPVRTARRRVREMRMRTVVKRQTTAQKPILRPALYEMLCARMQRLLHEDLQWR